MCDPEWVKLMMQEIKALLKELNTKTILHPPTRWTQIKTLICSSSETYKKCKRLRWEGHHRKLENKIKALQKIKPVSGPKKEAWLEAFQRANTKICIWQTKDDAVTRTNSNYKFQCVMGTCTKLGLQSLKFTRLRNPLSEKLFQPGELKLSPPNFPW
ncbi:hypothetical protein DSO57_1034161 [Entomophthora muscae]|uniref:Uncharacterized protein n=1 Tax=Entomophthora muscae TaxID=34485 RepID=A0ACC2S1V6_9FUNG|nr:hypothetical protein DSO57_1034161 [Entomophthora muscae]